MNTQNISEKNSSVILQIYGKSRKKLKGKNGTEFLSELNQTYANLDSFIETQIHKQIDGSYVIGASGKKEKIKWDDETKKFCTKHGTEFNEYTYPLARSKAIEKIVKELITSQNTNSYKEKNIKGNMNRENYYEYWGLEAHSINPEINAKELEVCVKDSLLENKNKKPIDQEELSKTIQAIGVYPNISEIGFQPSFDKYNVPEKLKPHRDAITLDFSDSIIVFRDGKISSPGKIIKAEYRDFVSTHLKRVPADLVPEVYPKGKTVAELLKDWKEPKSIVATFVGLAHFLTPSNGEEFSFVYRTKNLHIAPDCMALSGSTMKFPDRFNQKDFNWDTYLKEHLNNEMEEEYCLNPNEFSIGNIHFMNDIDEIPFLVAEIKTPYSTRELAEKAYNQPKPMKEHSIFFSTKSTGLNSILSTFDILPSTARVIDSIA